eukprot:scaffold26731_cov72-Phaeocystis_antarctica.AAC.1
MPRRMNVGYIGVVWARVPSVLGLSSETYVKSPVYRYTHGFHVNWEHPLTHRLQVGLKKARSMDCRVTGTIEDRSGTVALCRCCQFVFHQHERRLINKVKDDQHESS